MATSRGRVDVSMALMTIIHAVSDQACNSRSGPGTVGMCTGSFVPGSHEGVKLVFFEGKGREDRGLSPLFCLVGTAGFEPATP